MFIGERNDRGDVNLMQQDQRCTANFSERHYTKVQFALRVQLSQRTREGAR